MNKRLAPFLHCSFQTQPLQRCVHAGAPLLCHQSHHHIAHIILPWLPLILLRALQVQLPPGPALPEMQLYLLLCCHPDISQALQAGLGPHLQTVQLTFTGMKSALSRMAGNADLMQLEEHTMLITIPVLPRGNVLFLHQRLYHSVHHRHPDHNPTHRNLLVPVGSMPMSHYRTDGRNAAPLKGDRTSWIITRGRRRGTIRDRRRLPLLLCPRLLVPTPPSAHFHLDGKCG